MSLALIIVLVIAAIWIFKGIKSLIGKVIGLILSMYTLYKFFILIM